VVWTVIEVNTRTGEEIGQIRSKHLKEEGDPSLQKYKKKAEGNPKKKFLILSRGLKEGRKKEKKVTDQGKAPAEWN